MFGRGRKQHKDANPHNGSRGPMTYDIPIFFGIIFVLSIVEMVFTIDAFVRLERFHKWYSGIEKARMGFLIFSSARAIFLSSIYIGFHCCQPKNLMDTMHVIFLLLSTIFWVISGVLIHQMWGYVECENSGIADSIDQFKSQVEGGLSLCHEIKIIEIIAWAIAGVSVLATIPVVMTWMKHKKAKKDAKDGKKTATSA